MQDGMVAGIYRRRQPVSTRTGWITVNRNKRSPTESESSVCSLAAH